MFAHDTPRIFGILCTLAVLLAACATPETPASAPVVGQEPLSIGPAAQDTVGGWLPDDATLSPFDTANPIVGWIDPALLGAVQRAARAAQAEGIEMRISSGWRTKGFQQRLFADGIQRYGSLEAAKEFVASPEKSNHVTGTAVDIAPVEADLWLIANGPRFGLCQIYANEIWHFELAAVDGRCPPLKPNAAAD